MSARLVAVRLTDNPNVQTKIKNLLDRNEFTDRECEAVLVVTEAFCEGVRAAGGVVDAETLLRAGAVAVDTVWARRPAKGVVG